MVMEQPFLFLMDVNDGLHAKAVFDTVGIEGRYAGYAKLVYDANLSGVPDSGDVNLA